VPIRILAVGAAVGLLYFARPVLIPIVLSIFLFYALAPIVDRLQRLRMPRTLAAITVMLLLLGGLGVGMLALWPQFDAAVQRIPAGVQRFRTALRQADDGPMSSTLKSVQKAAEAIDRATASQQSTVTDRGTVRVEVAEPWRVSDVIWSGGVGALTLTAQGMSVLFLTVFLLIEDDGFKRKLVRRMQTLGEKRVTVEILRAISRQIQQFIWVQALTSAGVAVVTGLALWWLGMEEPAIWGLFAGIMNVVPYFGPLIVTVVLSAVSFLQSSDLSQAFSVGAISLLITTIEGQFVTPHLLSRASSINLVVMFVAVTFWSWVWGAAGMLLAVPILMATKVVCDHVDGLQHIAEFLDAEVTAPSPVEARRVS
jgi:predicted PurR-regulated permease PerM